MTEQLVTVEIADRVALVTLNRPDALNALNTAMRQQIVETFSELKEREDVMVVVLTGKGRAFCAGLDLKELGSGNADNADAVSDVKLVKLLRSFGKPIIGAINGFAITGGFELALMCDFMIAAKEAKFADTHSRVGIVPGWGLSQKLPRLIGVNRAKELSFTGNFLLADQAAEWGLVNRVVPAEELLPTAMELAKDITSCDVRTLSTVKQIMDDGWDNTLADGLRIEAQANQAHMDGVTPEELEARRTNVMARGRQQ